MEFDEQFKDGGVVAAVDVAGGLVGKADLGPVNIGAADGSALLFADGQAAQAMI
ncbi:MAG: hypothetical protein U0X20_30505 [Caldilineaceae bacterium]